jgi:hypothetical protein
MARRRELLSLLVAAFLLLVPGHALAAPTWLPSESLDAAGATVAPDVATDLQGNSVAVWLAGGEVRAAYRPRGGPWGTPESLDTGTEIFEEQPRVTVEPSHGHFVAVWLGERGTGPSYPLRWAFRPLGGDWSAPDTITGIGCCPGIAGLEASSEGGVLVMPTDEGTPSTNFKPLGSGQAWGPDEDVPTGQGTRLAMAPDGSAIVAEATTCGGEPALQCIVSAYRPPEGPWGPVVEAAVLPEGRFIGGFEIASAWGVSLTPTFSLVWGEYSGEQFEPAPPGRVRSADRGAGPGGAWGAPQTVADLPDEFPLCGFSANCFDLVTAAFGQQLASWHQSGDGTNRIMASIRPPGGAWGAAESAGDAGSSAAIPFAGVTTTDVPVVAWGSAISGEGVARASHRDGGGWHPLELADGGGLPPEDGVFLGDLEIDSDGNAVTAWRDPSGVAAAGFDAGPPRITAFSVPAGSAGQTLGFSAAADDNWSGLPAISWVFGDGASGSGSPVSHVYSAAGTYAVTATATDGVGNSAQRSGSLSVQLPPPPPPPGCGTADTDRDGIGNLCDDNNGAERPRPFRTVNATVVSGDVFVKLPAGSASTSQARPPRGFVRLEGAETIPVGSTLDTARGRVKIRSAATTGRRLQTGQFFRGRFLIRQRRIKRRSSRLITDMRLTGSSFRRTCRTTRAAVSQRRSKRRVRRLFGNAKGRFRTSGRNAAATVRGTRWGVQDRCDGTLVAVQQGRVEVRDLVKRKTIILRAGRTYVAKRR